MDKETTGNARRAMCLAMCIALLLAMGCGGKFVDKLSDGCAFLFEHQSKVQIGLAYIPSEDVKFWGDFTYRNLEYACLEGVGVIGHIAGRAGDAGGARAGDPPDT